MDTTPCIIIINYKSASLQFLQGRICLFLADEERASPDLGWAAQDGLDLAMETLRGDHYSIVAEPRVGQLAERLARCLPVAALSQTQRGS